MTKETKKNKEAEVEVTKEQPVTPQSIEVSPELPETQAQVAADEVDKKDNKKVETKKSAKSSKSKPTAEKTLDRLVMETKRGDHGTGRERMLSLGTRYAEVQRELVRRDRQASK